MVYGKSKHNFQRFNEFATRGTGWGKGKEGREREALNLSSASEPCAQNSYRFSKTTQTSFTAGSHLGVYVCVCV